MFIKLLASAAVLVCAGCISVNASRLRIGILNDKTIGDGLEKVEQEETIGVVIRWKR